MSLLKGPISLNWSKTTLARLKREWPKSGQSRNEYTELIHIKGLRYDDDMAAKDAEIAALKAEINKLTGN